MRQRETSIVRSFNKQIGKIIDYKLRNRTTVESAIVISLNADNTVNIQIPPDNVIYTHIQNQSIYQKLNVGDCVKVLKQNNSSSNMWIIGGHNLKSEIYPIGSIYMSVNNTNPSTLFGGTWEQIKDKFLLSAGDNYSAGSTGGEAEHTLTVNEMPGHSHNVVSSHDGARLVLNQSGVGEGSYAFADNWGNGRYSTWITDTMGGDQAHNNMPPYLTVYMWKRVA